MSYVASSPAERPSRSAPAATRDETAQLWAILLCLLFFVSGLVFVPYVGLESEELLFAGAIFPPRNVSHEVQVAGQSLPSMILGDAGTLKAWLYRLVFSISPPSPWSVRLPVLLLGMATLWLFAELARRAVGPRTGLIAAALLATDVTYILTTCLDAGPVALAHLFLVAGILGIWFYQQSGTLAGLGGGCFAFGLGLWDSREFLWSLAALAVAALVAFPRLTMRRLRPRALLVAAAGLALGAAPLWFQQPAPGGRDLRHEAHVSATGFSDRLVLFRRTLEGSALFGQVVAETPALTPAAPGNPIEEISAGVAELAGHPRAAGVAVAVIVAFALLPWLWNTPGRRTMLFAATFIAATWLHLSLRRTGGIDAHDAALLWPFPHLFAAAALAHASRLLRHGLILLIVTTVLVCCANLLVLNEHLVMLASNGNTVLWSDAIYPLSGHLRGNQAKHVYVMDDGIFDALRALNEGELPLENGRDVFLRETKNTLAPEMLSRTDTVFVGHTEGNEVDLGTMAQLDALAQSVGLRKQVLRTIPDRTGRPVFELYRFARQRGEPPQSPQRST